MPYKTDGIVSKLELWCRKKYSPILIKGCEAQGDQNVTYMERFRIVHKDAFGVYFHVFHRSDMDRVSHDHPWTFVTLILTGGYFEHIENRKTGEETVHWRRPGNILFRPAAFRHRVELPSYSNGLITISQKCTTLIFRFPYSREWGFWINNTWMHWREYFERNGCKP
jgi:hypothetical protein